MNKKNQVKIEDKISDSQKIKNTCTYMGISQQDEKNKEKIESTIVRESKIENTRKNESVIAARKELYIDGDEVRLEKAAHQLKMFKKFEKYKNHLL